MRKNDLRAQPRKAFRPKTTQRDHAAHPSPNILASAPKPSAPYQQIASDITYLRTLEGWLYLAIIIDLYTRQIVSWKLSDSLHSNVIEEALNEANSTGRLPAGAIFHSDQGCQYSSSQIRSLLSQLELRQSMSARGYCYDNAFSESLFASFKNEVLPESQCFDSKRSAATAVFDYFETFYNKRRLHSSLGYISPDDFYIRHFQNINTPIH